MNYLKSFFCEDDGVETIEFIALIAVAAVLVGVITVSYTHLTLPTTMFV